MNFEFASAARVIFGWGAAAQAAEIASRLGRSVLLVTGNDPNRAAWLESGLGARDMSCGVFQVSGEPSVQSVLDGVERARTASCDLVIGLGGGSALDTAKAIAALAANPGNPIDYLEVVGNGKPLLRAPLPWIGIPTTAGTGSEVTRNAVLTIPEHQVKVSLRSPLMLAHTAVIDPELTLSMPARLTVSTGMDALAQVLEPFVSVRANPVSDGFSREGLSRAVHCLRRAVIDGSDRAAREGMCVVSLMGGLALSNAGLGAVHGLAGPIGGLFPGPHGALCAALLAPVVSCNLRALRARQPDSPALDRYLEAARLLTGNPNANADDGVECLRALQADLGIQGLMHWGVSPAHFPVLVERAGKANSMQANPIRLEPEEIEEILTMAL